MKTMQLSKIANYEGVKTESEKAWRVRRLKDIKRPAPLFYSLRPSTVSMQHCWITPLISGSGRVGHNGRISRGGNGRVGRGNSWGIGHSHHRAGSGVNSGRSRVDRSNHRGIGSNSGTSHNDGGGIGRDGSRVNKGGGSVNRGGSVDDRRAGSDHNRGSVDRLGGGVGVHMC